MKHTFLITLFLATAVVLSAYSTTKDKSFKRTITTKSILYDEMSTGWNMSGETWLYFDKPINITPAIYKFEITESTFNKEEVEIGKKITEEISDGTYESLTDDWVWENDSWYFAGKPVKTFPPRFVKKSEVKITESEPLQGKSSDSSYQLEETYNLQAGGWSWNKKKGEWFKDGKPAETHPAYTCTRSMKSVPHKTK